ncbi:MAG TPA: tRNA epoxyqueuosine(34) reductase QueG [Myxococcota bacterium]|nr:tRNA epoxyqueuosine(34) reductase QueG [Myxococcota bacterium]
MEHFNETIKAFGKKLGFDDIGIAEAKGPLPYTTHVLDAFYEGRFGPLDYLSRTLAARLDLLSIFKEAKSVVIVVKNYYTGDHNSDEIGKAKIARYAWGKDYHRWFKKRLLAFRSLFTEKFGPNIKFWLFNDTGPFLERSWALKAGLGFIGKSSMFIHRQFGTWTLLGGFATDQELRPDPPYQGPDCGRCKRCIDACPTQAIIGPQQVDARKCISTWTIERPLHEDAKRLAPRNHEWAFGCDICQEVCPWNKFQQLTREERFLPLAGRVFLSKETFAQDLAGSALNRSTKLGLLANYLRIQNSLANPGVKVLR